MSLYLLLNWSGSGCRHISIQLGWTDMGVIVRSLAVAIIAFFTIFNLIVRAEAATFQVRGALPKNARFLTASAKLRGADRMKFETLAGIAKLRHVSQMKVLGYPVVFDLLASDTTLQKVIILGSQQVGKELADKLYLEEDGIFAPVTIDGRPMSLLFIGFSVEEVQADLQRFKGQYVATEQKSQGRMPASETAIGGPDVGTAAIQPTSKVDEALQYTYALGDSFKECGLGAVDGFNAITWDPVKKASYSLWNLITNTQGWIDASKQEVKNLANTLVHFDAFARKQWTDWHRKTPQEKSRFYCSFLGGGVGVKSAAEVTGQLATKVAGRAGRSAETATTGTTTTVGERSTDIPRLYTGNAPYGLVRAVRNIIDGDSPYMGRNWWEFPPEGGFNYPYITDRTSLNALKGMTERPVPDPATLKPGSGWPKAAESMRNSPNSIERIDRAIKGGSDIVIDGKPYVLVQGEKYNAARLPTATDFKPAPATRNNVTTGQKVVAEDGKFRSISSLALEYQGNGTIGYSKKVPQIQGRDVKVIIGDKVIEGRYLSSGGPHTPRGASYTQLSESRQESVKFHFIQVENQTLMVPADGAEIFAKY